MSDIPSGAMVQINIDLIGEGELRKEFDEAIAEAHQIIARRREKGNFGGGKATVTATVSLEYDPDLKDTIVITHCVSTKTPKNEKVSMAAEKAGVMLCQLTGAGEDTPHQQRLFDRTGRAIGTLNPHTGELTEPPSDVAGVVGRR